MATPTPSTIWAHRWRHLVLALSLLVVGAFATGLVRLKNDLSLESWFVDDDPAVVSFNRLQDAFGNDDYVVIAFEEPADRRGVFNNRALAAIDALTTQAQGLEYVNNVYSATNLERVYGTDDQVIVESYVKSLPLDDAQLAGMRDRMLADDWAVNFVVSADGTVAAVVAEIAYTGADFVSKRETVEKLRALAESTLPFPFHISGEAVVDKALDDVSIRDAITVMPLTVLAVAGVLWFLFRNTWGVLGPLLTLLLTNIVVFGAMGWLGIPINMLTTVLPVLLLLVCVGDSIHLVGFYQARLPRMRAAGGGPADALGETIRHIWFPCLMTTLTTLVGFLALFTSRLEVMRGFSAMAAFGVVVAYVLSLTFLPAFLAVTRPALPAPEQLTRVPTGDGLFRMWRTVVGDRHWAIVFVHVGFMLGGVFLARDLVVDSDTIKYFSRSEPVRVDTEWIDQHIGGALSVEVLVEGAVPGHRIDTPGALRGVEAVERTLRSEPHVTYTASLAGLVRRLSAAFDPSAPPGVPASEKLIRQLLLVYSGNDLDRLADPNWEATRLHAQIRQISAREIDGLLERLQAAVQRELPDYEVDVTGTVVLRKNFQSHILRGLVDGGTLAALLVTVCMIGACRSFLYGLVAMIPNLIPLATIPAVMALAGISIDLGTSLSLCLCLGTIVDDMIYIMTGYLRSWREGRDPIDCVRAALDGSGREIVLNSLILIGGFVFLMLSSFRPNFYCGLLVAATIIVDLEVTLFLTPSLLVLIGQSRQMRRGLGAAGNVQVLSRMNTAKLREGPTNVDRLH